MASALLDESTRLQREFLARRSHDLRSPLNVILGFAELLLTDESAPLTPLQREQALHIQAAGERLLAQLQALMDHARLDLDRLPLRAQTFDLIDVVREAVSRVDEAARARQVRLVLQLDALRPAAVQGDRARVRQVLDTLLRNAVRFTPIGSTVTLQAWCDEGHATLDVVDQGPGLTTAQHAVLFEPFALAARDAAGLRGSGVGLAVARGLARRMGGELAAIPADRAHPEAASDPATPAGSGCHMQLRLPTVTSARTPDAGPPGSAGVPAEAA